MTRRSGRKLYKKKLKEQNSHLKKSDQQYNDFSDENETMNKAEEINSEDIDNEFEDTVFFRDSKTCCEKEPEYDSEETECVEDDYDKNYDEDYEDDFEDEEDSDINYVEYYEDNRNYVDRGSKVIKYLIVSFSVIIVLMIVSMTFYFSSKKTEIANLASEAEEYVKKGDYQEAIDIYSDLYYKTGDVKYRSKKLTVSLIKMDQKIITSANIAERNGEYFKALRLNSQIPKEDPEFYSDSRKNIEKIRVDIKKAALKLFNEGKKDDAIYMLTEYLYLYPNDSEAFDIMEEHSGISTHELEKMFNVKKKDNGKPEKKDDKKDEKSDTQKDKKDDEKNEDTKQQVNNPELQKFIDSIKGKDMVITARGANVRDTHSMNSGVIATLKHGDKVHIIDVYATSKYDVWCKVDGGWISYATLNGSIR